MLQATALEGVWSFARRRKVVTSLAVLCLSCRKDWTSGCCHCTNWGGGVRVGGRQREILPVGKQNKMRADKRRDREMTRENMWVTSPLSKVVSFILPLFLGCAAAGQTAALQQDGMASVRAGAGGIARAVEGGRTQSVLFYGGHLDSEQQARLVEATATCSSTNQHLAVHTVSQQSLTHVLLVRRDPLTNTTR